MDDVTADAGDAEELFGNHGTNTQLMVMAAHRYCLGRMSYIVHACVDWMIANRKRFEANTVRVMLRDTIEALQQKRAGMGCDEGEWRRLVPWLMRELSEDDRDWVMRAVASRPWPEGLGDEEATQA